MEDVPAQSWPGGPSGTRRGTCGYSRLGQDAGEDFAPRSCAFVPEDRRIFVFDPAVRSPRVGAPVDTRGPVDVHADVSFGRWWSLYDQEKLATVLWRGLRLRLPLAPLLPPGPVSLGWCLRDDPWQADAGLSGDLSAPLEVLRAHPDRFDGVLTAWLDLACGPDGRWTAEWAPVSYFLARAVEQLLDGPRDLRRADQATPGQLPPLRSSALACDIGVVVVLRTSDGRVVVQQRSPALDWRPGVRSASASGSVEPKLDLQAGIDGLDALLAGARRELAEELGVGGPHDPEAAGLRLRSLGVWRELDRGGKPELYVAASTPLPFAAVEELWETAPDARECVGIEGLDDAAVARLLDPCAHAVDAAHLPGVDLTLVAGLLLSGADGAALVSPSRVGRGGDGVRDCANRQTMTCELARNGAR